MPLLEANPSHKLYVTGHSLGAALSTVVSFKLSCEESIQKPVMCINFASPRVGDAAFLEAVTVSSSSKPHTHKTISQRRNEFLTVSSSTTIGTRKGRQA